MTETLGSPNQWDVFVYWGYGVTILLLGGYTWYLVRMNKRLKEQERDLKKGDL